MGFATELIVIVLMLILNALFAAFEMALASISHAQLQVLADQKKAGAASALYMKENMNASLAFVQIGITLIGAIAAATGGAGVGTLWAPRLGELFHLPPHMAEGLAVVMFVVPLSGAMVVLGELIPKVFAIENKEWVCLTLSPAMRGAAWLCSPLVNLLEGCVRIMLRIGRAVLGKSEVTADASSLQDLKAAVSLARTKHLMGAQEERIVLSAALLSRRKIREIALPASEISMIPSTLSLPEALIRAHLDLHTRFPIASAENDPQSIEGYITFKDLVTALKMHAVTPDVRGIARPIKRILADMTISSVLEQMIRERLHIALVVEHRGTVHGLVTLEDIIEELVGDIEDEADSLPSHIHPTSGGWIMGGGVPMNAVSSRVGIPWSTHFANPNTLRLTDWAEQILGRAVRKGETLRADALQVTVRKIRRRKIAEAFVRKDLDTGMIRDS